MRLALICLLVLTLGLIAVAQVQFIEYGNIYDLRGVTEIYIYTGMDLKTQNNIAKQIMKRLENKVRIVRNPLEAEAILAYGEDCFTGLLTVINTAQSTSTTTGQVRTYTYGDYTNGTLNATTQTNTNGSSTPIYLTKIEGKGMVFQLVNKGQTMRLVKQFDDGKIFLWERKPSTNFARAFTGAWKEANDGYDPIKEHIHHETMMESAAAIRDQDTNKKTAEPLKENATPPPGFGEIRIESTPKGASVFVNERFMGMTPARIRLPQGTHAIRLFLYGHKEWRQTLDLSAGSEVSLTVELKP